MGERIFTREDAKSIFRTNSEKVKLPSDFTVIGTGSLAGFSQVKELTIPEGVTKICSHAFFIRSFRGTSTLEKLVIPSSLQDFELWCFYDCNALKSIVVSENFPEQKAMELFFHCPNAIISFGKKLFSAKKKSVQQIMDETSGILSMGSAMMLPIDGDGTLRIPSNYYYIQPSAMKNLANRGIKRVVIPEKMQVISAGAFSFLSSMEEVVISEGVEHIDNGAFAGCKNLKRIVIPDSVRRIGAGAFMNLPQLTSIRLPRNLTAIEDDLFSGCTALTDVSFGGQEIKVGAGAFNECNALKKLRLPESVESVGICAFWNCTALQQLSIPSGAKSIGQSALCNCHSLARLYMPHIISEGPEHKRVFGEHTAPDIVWLEPGTVAPEFSEITAEIPSGIPDFPSQLPFGFATSAQNDQPLPSETGSASAQTAASVSAPPSTAPAAEGEPVDAATVQKLQETIAAIQAQLAEMQRESHNGQSVSQTNPGLIEAMQQELNAMQGAVASADTASAVPTPVQESVELPAPELSAAETQEATSVLEIADETVQQSEETVEAVTDVVASEPSQADPVSEAASAPDVTSEDPDKVSEEISESLRPEVNPAAEPDQTLTETAPEQFLSEQTSAPAEDKAAAEEAVPASDAATDEAESADFTDITPATAPVADRPELPKEFDACISFIPLRHGEYNASDRVFTREISKPMVGPKERSMALKEYSIIGYRSFREAQPGERFEIPEGVRGAETQAFWDAPRLMAIEIPTTLTEVEPDAFSGASRLTDIYVRDGFPERRIVEYFLFRPEAKVHWPKKGLLSKPRISTIAELMEQFDDILTPAKAKKLTVRGHILQIPEGYTIIAPGALQEIDQRADDPEQVLRTIFLPKSIRRIGTKAFSGLENVMHIVIPSGLQIVDMNAFTGCLGPRRIVLPDSVQYIGPRAFAAPCNYEQIRLPGLIRELPENALADCNTLVSVRIPDSVEKIGDCALAGCTALSTLTIPKRFEEQLPLILDGPVKLNVTWTDGEYASYQQAPTPEILSVVEPSFPTVNPQRLFTQELSASCSSFAERVATLHAHPYIAPFALSEMANQTKFEIPLGVMRLSSYSFGMNTRLLTLTVPKALNEFEYGAFYGCLKLRDVFLPEEFDRGTAAVLFMRRPQILVTFGTARAVRVRQLTAECPWILSPGDAADLKVDHVTLRIPEGYLVVASYMYHGIMGLQCLHRIELPSSVRLIGSLAFVQLPYLEEVVCPEGLLAVEPDAFTDCPALKRIVLPKSLKFLGVHAFHGCNELTSIVLPARFEDRAVEIKRDCPQVTITWLPEDIAETVEQAVIGAEAQSGGTTVPHSDTPISPEALAEQAMQRAKAMLVQEETESVASVESEAEHTDELQSEEIAAVEASEEVLPAETSPEPEEQITESPVDTEQIPEEQAAEESAAIEPPAEDLTTVATAEIEPIPEVAETAEIPEEIEKLAHSLFGTEQPEEKTESAEESVSVEEQNETEVSDEPAEPVEPEVSQEIHELAESLFADIPEAVQNEDTNAEAPVPAIFGENSDSLESGDLHDLSSMEPIAGSGATPEMIGRTEEDSLELKDNAELSAIDGADETAVPDETEALPEAESAGELPDTDEPSEADVPIADTADVETAAPAEETAEPAADEAEASVEAESAEEAVEEPESGDDSAEDFVTEPAEDTVSADEAEAEETDAFNAEPETTVAEESDSEEENSESAESDMPDISEISAEEEIEPAAVVSDEAAEEVRSDSVGDMLDLPEVPSLEEQEDTVQEAESIPAQTDDSDEDMPGLPEIPMPELTEQAEDTDAEETEEIDESENDSDEIDEDMPGLPELILPDAPVLENDPDTADSEMETVVSEEETDDDLDLDTDQDDEPDAAVLIEKMQLADALGITLDDSDIVQIMTEEPPEWPVHVEDFGSRIEPGMLPESELAGQPPIPEDGKFTAKECRMRYKGEPEFRIPHGFTEIRAGACAAMDDLERLIVPDTVTRIGSGAFADNLSLTEVMLPATIEEIAEDAFEGCEALMRVTMPRSLEAAAAKMLGPQTHVIWLETEKPAIIGDGRFTAKIRGKVYDDGDTLTVPEGYTEIRAGACAGLEDLKQVILPNTLVKICSGAFADCTALTEVTIPSGVTDLDADAFEGCTAISRVIVSPQLADAAKECFPNAAVLIRN